MRLISWFENRVVYLFGSMGNRSVMPVYACLLWIFLIFLKNIFVGYLFVSEVISLFVFVFVFEMFGLISCRNENNLYLCNRNSDESCLFWHRFAYREIRSGGIFWIFLFLIFSFRKSCGRQKIVYLCKPKPVLDFFNVRVLLHKRSST